MNQQQSLTILKIVFMIVFFAIVVSVGLLPLRSTKFKTNQFLKSLGTTFAGALFINVSILHILPENAQTLKDYLRTVLNKNQDQQIFPLSNLLLMIGFSITIFFTRIIAKHSHQNQHCHLDLHQHTNFSLLQKKKNSVISDQNNKDINYNIQNSQIKQVYFLTMAMYFHTIFQGIAIGVQNSLGGFLSTAIAIAFHKWADALSMGINYRKKNISLKIGYILIIGQALLNVLSIGVGWIISSQGPVVEAIFLSISAGTFLAISTMQMLSDQLHKQKYKYYKFGVILFSILFISAVWFIQNSIFSEETSNSNIQVDMK